MMQRNDHMTSRTNSPSEAAHGTARLPNPSTTLSKEVEEVVAHLRAYPLSFFEQAADLLTRISAERDRLEMEREEVVQALRFRGAVVAHGPVSWCVAGSIDTFRAAAERAKSALKAAEAERDLARQTLDEFIAQSQRAENATLKGAIAERDALKAVLQQIAKGETPPEPHGHYLAHRECVRVARSALAAAEGRTDG